MTVFAKHSPTGYPPPIVKWIEERGHGYPDPPPDPNASELDSLRYHAALIKARCGIDCRIGQLNHHSTYDYVVYTEFGQFRESGNCGNHLETQYFLNGIETGARAAKK